MEGACKTNSESPTTYVQKTFDLENTIGIRDALHEDGCALIPGVLSPEECSRLRDAIDSLAPMKGDRVGRHNELFKCVFNRDKLFLDMIDRAGIVDAAESVMGNECHIIGETAWKTKPGHDGWKPHTDRVLIEMAPTDVASGSAFRLPVFIFTAHYYLNDVPLELAPTWILPGSHKSGRRLRFGEDPDPEWEAGSSSRSYANRETCCYLGASCGIRGAGT